MPRGGNPTKGVTPVKPDPKTKDDKDEKSKVKTDETDTEKDTETDEETEQDEEKDAEGEDDDKPAETVEELKAALTASKEREKKSRDESIKRRQDLKKTKAENDRLQKGLAIIQGKKEGDIDPVEKAQTESKAKVSRAILRSEIANHAKDAHDPKMLLQVAPDVFADIDVDVDTETVDEDALKTAIDALRTAKPFLFQTKGEGDDDGKGKGKNIVKMPPGGPAANGKNAFATWKQLQSQGRSNEAAAYYIKHHKQIKEVIKANPSLV